ncbi:hypothetical protein [Streptomyces sp. NPDC101206]|uniref:hypothetical protein n=1 Tax=Streptomyces sp. NPDC101206 TaxID=3366128 RepID=UPI00382CAB8F
MDKTSTTSGWKARRTAAELCGHGIADTLNHQLPKIVYPLLAVAPLNLVPACRGCNSHRSELAPRTAEEQTLHPYCDDLGDHVWLTARVQDLPKRP